MYLKNSLGSLKETYGSINSAWTYVMKGKGVGFPKLYYKCNYKYN